MPDDVKLPEPDLLFGTPADGSPLKEGYTAATVRRLIAEAVERERERWKQHAEAMAQEADHKFTMDGTVAHWLRALAAKRGA